MSAFVFNVKALMSLILLKSSIMAAIAVLKWKSLSISLVTYLMV